MPDMPQRPMDLPLSMPLTLLRAGSQGEDVKALQRALRTAGYLVSIDGHFGPVTECCLRSFQATHHLARCGATTLPTWNALGGAAHA